MNDSQPRLSWEKKRQEKRADPADKHDGTIVPSSKKCYDQNPAESKTCSSILLSLLPPPPPGPAHLRNLGTSSFLFPRYPNLPQIPKPHNSLIWRLYCTCTSPHFGRSVSYASEKYAPSRKTERPRRQKGKKARDPPAGHLEPTYLLGKVGVCDTFSSERYLPTSLLHTASRIANFLQVYQPHTTVPPLLRK